MIKELVIRLKDNKGYIENDNNVSLTNGDSLKFSFIVDNDTLTDEWFYKLRKADQEDKTTKFGNDLSFVLLANYFTEEALQIVIIRKSKDLIYPEQFEIEPIKINTVSLIGNTMAEVYPNKIIEIENTIKDLKIIVLALKSEIDDLKKVGDIL